MPSIPGPVRTLINKRIIIGSRGPLKQQAGKMTTNVRIAVMSRWHYAHAVTAHHRGTK